MGQRQSPGVWFLVPDVPSHPKPYPECCSVTQGYPSAYSPTVPVKMETKSSHSMASDLPGGITEAFVQQGGEGLFPQLSHAEAKITVGRWLGLLFRGGC